MVSAHSLVIFRGIFSVSPTPERFGQHRLNCCSVPPWDKRAMTFPSPCCEAQTKSHAALQESHRRRRHRQLDPD